MNPVSSITQRVHTAAGTHGLGVLSMLRRRAPAKAAPWTSILSWRMPILILVLALSFNLYRLGSPSVWFDEAFSVELARQPLPLLWKIISGPEPNMGLYYLVLHAWLSLTAALGLHATEFVVRLPSAVFAACSTLVVFFLGKQLLQPRAGLIAALLFLLNDLQLVYAQQARSYSLQLLLICIAWYALLVALTADFRTRRWWLCFVVATILAVYAHLFSLIILLAQVCACVGMLLLPQPWRGRSRRQIPALLISLGAICLGVMPALAHLNFEQTSWLPAPRFLDVVRLALTISGGNRLYLLALAASCGAGLLAAQLVALLGWAPHGLALAAGCQRCRPWHHTSLPVGLALLCWLLVPLVTSYVISQGPVRLFSSRYLVTIVPSLCLLAAMGVCASKQRVQIVVALLLLALALSCVPYYYRSAQVEDWRATSLWIEQRYQAGDGLVCYDNALEQGCQIALEYYFHAYPGPAHFDPDSPGAFSWRTFRSVAPDAAVKPRLLAAYAAKHARIFFIIGRLPNDEAAGRAQAARAWLDSHYHFMAQIVTRTVKIRLYATNFHMLTS